MRPNYDSSPDSPHSDQTKSFWLLWIIITEYDLHGRMSVSSDFNLAPYYLEWKLLAQNYSYNIICI